MQKTISVVIRILICMVIIAMGVLILKKLTSMRTDPVQAENFERALRVDVQEAQFEDVEIFISGLGTVRPKDVVTIAPEIAGRIVNVHSRLEVGEIIPAGEMLFRIDPRDYQAQLTNTQAAVSQIENSVKRLNKQFAIDKNRLKTFERSRDLANAEYKRILKLYQAQSVVSQSQVDSSEMAYNNANDAFDQLSQSVDLFPLRIQEAENSLTSAKAIADLAATNLERTEVSVDFDARIKTVNLERGQYITPGINALSLADDSIMEISVPLNSKEARQWLRIHNDENGNAWFTGLEQVPVVISWTENPADSRWEGILHRVEKFDEQTRQLTVVVRITGREASKPSLGTMPLVDGMFCKVNIPGRIASQVTKVPATSVGFEQDDDGYRKLYLAQPGDTPNEYRLKITPVLISYMDGEYMYVSKGLEEKDLVVTTRLIAPLENTLLITNMVNHTETD